MYYTCILLSENNDYFNHNINYYIHKNKVLMK